MAPLRNLARVIRSKNVGPFMMALDIVFDDRATYERVVRSGVITRESIAALYHVKPETITDVVYYDPGNAIKVSLLRPIPSGNFSDADVLGSQQYAPLHDIEVPD
jgi:hypothetical protein